MSENLIAAHDGAIIWGVGVDEAEARDDAAYWPSVELHGLQFSTMTDRLAAYVDQWGFDGKHDTFRVLPDRRLDLED